MLKSVRPGTWLPSWSRSWMADSSALLFSQLAANLTTSALAVLLARHLGPRDWGIFSAFLSLSVAVGFFIEFGLTQWLLRELSDLWAGRETERRTDDVRARAGQIVLASLAVNVAFGAVMIIGAIAVAGASHIGTTSMLLLVSMAAFGACGAACGELEAVFRARRRLRLVVGATLLEKVVLLSLVSGVIVVGFGVVAIGFAYLFAGLVHVVFDAVVIIRSGDLTVARPSKKAMRYVTRESMPFALNRASLNVVPLLDTVILAALSPIAAGYFAIGARALNPVIMIPVVLSSALYPFLAGESVGSRAGLRVAGVIGAAGGAMAVLGVALAPFLVPVLFGSKYTNAVLVVQIMIVATPFIFAANPLLTHVYTGRLEHRTLALGLAVVSCLGTAAIIVGQILVGPAGAAAGFVCRQVFFVAVLVLASTSFARSVSTKRAGGSTVPRARSSLRSRSIGGSTKRGVNGCVRSAERAASIVRAGSFGSYAAGDLAAAVFSASVAVAIGAAVVVNPLLAVLPAVALAGILLLVDARARILFLVFGGFLALQSSSSLGSIKLVYLAGVFMSLGGALFKFRQGEDRFARRLARPLMRVSVAMSTLILISLLVSRVHSIPGTDSLRDIAPYVLFACAPVFAIDAARAFSHRGLVRLLVIAGILATLSFTITWLEGRGIAQLPLSKFALSSFYFPAAVFVYATASALHRNHHRIRWASLSVLVFALMISTGTRETLILAVAPIALAISARRRTSSRFIRLAFGGPVAVVLMLSAAYVVLATTHASTTQINDRIATLENTGTTKDASYHDRQAQTRAAAHVFHAHPIFGAGPGIYFHWISANGTPTSAFVIDSPVDFPAKFGIVGLVVVGFLVLGYGSFLRSALRFNHPRPETLALAGYAAVAIAGSLLSPPLEDKGLSFGLILLLALVFRTWTAAAPVPDGSQAPRRRLGGVDSNNGLAVSSQPSEPVLPSR
jgi:O-antigen/teichoic acid export membrane protein